MKFGLSDEVIAELNSCFHAIPEIEKVVIFGSRAKGNYHAGSDVDLAIFGNGVTREEILRLLVKIDDMGMLYKVDVVDYKTISTPELKDHIDRIGIIFYEKR